MLKQQNLQSSNRVRTANTLHVGFEVPCNSQVGCVAQSRTRSVRYAGYGLLRLLAVSIILKVPHHQLIYPQVNLRKNHRC